MAKKTKEKKEVKVEEKVEAVAEQSRKLTLEAMNPAHAKVLKRIQDSIPVSWLENLVEKKPAAPGMKEACERAQKDPDVNEETKRKAQILLDSGVLDKTIEVVNKYFEKLINDFIDKEIAAAVRRGELPHGKKHRNFDKKLKRIIKAKHDLRGEEQVQQSDSAEGV